MTLNHLMGPFMSNKSVSVTFFIDCYTKNLFLTLESVFLLALSTAAVEYTYCISAVG